MSREYSAEQRARWRADERARIKALKLTDPEKWRALRDKANEKNVPYRQLTEDQRIRYRAARIEKRLALIAADPEAFYTKERAKCRDARNRRIARDGHAVERRRESTSWFRHQYGITMEERDEWYARIRSCESCGVHHDDLPPGRTPTRRLHIDHDHATGKLRGLLCIKCNLLMGLAKDSVATLRSAIAYLESRS